MNAHKAKLAAILSIAAAVVCSFIVFTWYLSLNQMNLAHRPSLLVWRMVTHALRAEDVAAGGYQIEEKDPGIITVGSWCIRLFGGNYRALMSYQYVFLAVLLVSVGAFAWILGGPYAGALAPWFALLTPLTIGLATAPDDHLALQALLAAAMALAVYFIGARQPGLALLSAVPMILAIYLSGINTNALLLICTYAAGVFGIVVWVIIKGLIKRSALKQKSWLPSGPVLAQVLIMAGVALYLIIRFGSVLLYYRNELHNYRFASLQNNPLFLAGYFVIWFRQMVGPVIGFAALAGLITCVIVKKGGAAGATAAWFFIPLFAFSAINKRQDYYLFYAVPATYVLPALALAGFSMKKLRLGATAVLMLVAGLTWLGTLHSTAVRPKSLPPGMFVITYPYYSLAPSYRPDIYTWIDQECGRRGLRPLFIQSSSVNIDQWAIPLWQYNKNTIALDFASKEALEDKPYCILLSLKDSPIIIDLGAGFALFREQAKEITPFSKSPRYTLEPAKIAALERMIPMYRYAGAFENVSLFLPDSGPPN